MANITKYTPDDIRRAAAVYAVEGYLSRTAEQVGIPRITLHYWKNNKPEWEEAFNHVRQEKLEELDADYSKIISRATENVLERFNVGDYAGTDQEGNTLYKPVSARDSAWVMGVTFDKRQILRNQPTSISASVDNKALQDMKAQFEALAGRTIDGERVE